MARFFGTLDTNLLAAVLAGWPLWKPPAAKPSAAELPPVPPAAGPGAAPRVLEVERAVAFVLRVLRKGDHNSLDEVKRHVARGKDFLVRGRHNNCLYPAEALKIALSQYEEEVRTSKPATLPAAPAASSPAAEEVAAPPPGKRQRLEVPDEKKALLNKGGGPSCRSTTGALMTSNLSLK